METFPCEVHLWFGINTLYCLIKSSCTLSGALSGCFEWVLWPDSDLYRVISNVCSCPCPFLWSLMLCIVCVIHCVHPKTRCAIRSAVYGTFTLSILGRKLVMFEWVWRLWSEYDLYRVVSNVACCHDPSCGLWCCVMLASSMLFIMRSTHATDWQLEFYAVEFGL